MNGDAAACEGALAAGARFAAGYPITPSTEIVERFASRAPQVGGLFIQMEDELAASITLPGMVWAGQKSFTSTSGPGFSLMMEHIGYAAMTETPCVFFNVQRGGPSTGLPTLPAQGDMMQARFGSHGDYSLIALVPNSPQECFWLAVKAFNLAEQFRVPVMVMMDECVGHMTEKVVIPKAEEIEIFPRRAPSKPPGEFLAYGEIGEDLVPEMAIQLARAKGIKVGRMRLQGVWPFPEKRFREVAQRIKAFVAPELNMGQVVLEVERCAGGHCRTIALPHAGGTVHRPLDILAAIEKGAQA